jgi:ribonuclease HI
MKNSIADHFFKQNRYWMRFDGLFRRINGTDQAKQTSGYMSYGWLIDHNDRVIATGHGVFLRGRDANSNIAEYLALIEGLEALRDLGVRHEPVTIFGDAKCVLDQMCGSSSVHSETTRPFYNRATRAARWFVNINWKWTPRRENKAADWLSRRAIKQVYQDNDNLQTTLKTLKSMDERGRTKKLHPIMDLRVYHPAFNINAGDIVTLPQLLNTWGNRINRSIFTLRE